MTKADPALTADWIAAHFTRPDGSYLCARWGRPIVPVAFGLQDPSLRLLKGAIEAVVALGRHKMAETDPELGANLMFFFFRDWSELPQVPNLDQLVPGLADRADRLSRAGASRYRTFRFDPSGAIKAAFVFLKMEGAMAEIPAEDLMLNEALQIMLTWSETAFDRHPPLVQLPSGGTALHPAMARLLPLAYDPVLPAVARDPSHALRLAARALHPPARPQ